MPNPRITFRVTPELLEQLPADPDERSRFVVQAIEAKINPPAPEGEMGNVLSRLETMESAMVVVLDKLESSRRSSPRRAPSDLDQAIKQVLERTPVKERRQASKLFDRLQEFVSPA